MPGPGPRGRLTPLTGIGLRYIKRRPQTLSEAHAGVPGKPNVVWASCVIKDKNKPPFIPKMVQFFTDKSGVIWVDYQFLHVEIIHWTDPCK